jgi:hypothetical protein
LTPGRIRDPEPAGLGRAGGGPSAAALADGRKGQGSSSPLVGHGPATRNDILSVQRA